MKAEFKRAVSIVRGMDVWAIGWCRFLLVGWVALAGMSGAVEDSAGAVLVAENFEDYAGGSIVGANGGTGWDGAWQQGTDYSGAATVNSSDPISGLHDLQLLSSPAGAEVCVHRQFGALTGDQSYSLTWQWQLDYGIEEGGTRYMFMDLRSGNGGDKFDERRLQVYFRSNQSYIKYGDGTFHDTSLDFGNAGDLFSFSVSFNPVTRSYAIGITNETQHVSENVSGAWTWGEAGDSIDSIAFSANTGTNAAAFVDDIQITGSSDPADAVPEPTVLSLCGVACVILCYCCRLHRLRSSSEQQ